MCRTEDLHQILAAMKRAHLNASPVSADTRRGRLNRSVQLIRQHRDALVAAMSADFGNRSVYQSTAADLATTVNMLAHAAQQVEAWMAPEAVATHNPNVRAWIQPQPLGVVGVISPWNFPINLAFGPLAGVFAAGNTALLKPSELTPRTSELLAELVGRYFDPMELGVVLGDAHVGETFSTLPFDHLVFTGSTQVGRKIMRAAAENLVPVTLELGGKSPVVVLPDADVTMAAERTLTVKAFNAGQICLAPDYVLLPAGQEAAFADAARQFMATAYPRMQGHADYTSVVSDRHYARLLSLIENARNKGARVLSLAPAGEPDADPATRKIAVHLILGATDDMTVMQEEIFGPLLPVRTYATVDEAIAYINAHPRPLAAYLFGGDAQAQRHFADRTTSGALVINDVMTHAAIETLPFGGVGASGMGAYHGIHGFRRFSHAKAVAQQHGEGPAVERLRPPYADKLAPLQAALG